MIYTFKEQLLIIIYFILIGMFLGIMFDIINCLFENNILNCIIQLIIWGIVSFLCLLVVDNICSGYLPFYFLLFFGLGFLLYYFLLRIRFIEKLNHIKKYKKSILICLFPIDVCTFCIAKIKKLKKIIKKKKKD